MNSAKSLTGPRNRTGSRRAHTPSEPVVEALRAYQAKRNFSVTAEPSGDGTQQSKSTAATQGRLSFVVQKHWASSLHYDFRLELDGTMKSWAVPKGPSLDPKDKRLAVQVEDHPIAYSSFEGSIPAGQYGAGRVIIWDKGLWKPLGDPQAAYADGNLKFALHGHKLQGHWALVRMDSYRGKQAQWLLIKEKDDFARPAQEFSVVDALPDSVAGIAKHAVLDDEPGPSKTLPEARSGSTSTATTALPQELKPQLATLVEQPPGDGEQWIYEIKYDGYRILTRVENGQVQFFTRTGKDWTGKLPTLLRAMQLLALPSGWYDGEIVVNDPQTGRPNFAALQACMDSARSDPVVLYLFDAPYCDGRDLRQVPLHERRALLQKCLATAGASSSSQVRFSPAFEADSDSLMASACRLGLEGIMGKRSDAHYVSRRTRDWIKLKCHLRQEFVVGGYTEPQGTRKGVGALLLGVYDDHGHLQYAGKVGTGFTEHSLRDTTKKVKAVASRARPFVATADIEGKPHWLQPLLVAEVAFQEWTPGGRIRQAVFHGLREDKDARAIRREEPLAQMRSAPTSKRNTHSRSMVGVDKTRAVRGSASRSTADPRITHPERTIDPYSGLSKLDLVHYYQQVENLIAPHLAGRPTAVLRAPSGIDGELFFQKHLRSTTLAGLQAVTPVRGQEANAMMEVRGAQGLLSAAQWNVVEFHTANASTGWLARPDRMVFDLDPGEGVSWEQMQEAALLVHNFLEQLGLQSFLKTSGGKGLHVVVPLRRMQGWAIVKGISQAIVQHLSAQIPQRFVAKSGPANRVGKIFIDYLRNGEGATTVSAWSARARPGMGISVPVAWDELAQLRAADQWTVSTAADRLPVGNSPWDAYAKSARSPSVAMKKLGYKPTA
ncbi:MAG: DNA ligase D [Pseudomonadota bacterium]